MVRCLLSLWLLLGIATTVTAQVTPYNPYAPQTEDPSPVRSDGKPNWPAFYRSAATAARFQSYFEMGSCVGTREKINNMLKENKVDVNKLPESSVSGRVIAVQTGGVVLVDKDNHKVGVVPHPAGVSRIDVGGTLRLAALRNGMTVRLLSSVDAHGQRNEPISAFEIISPGAVAKVPEIVPNKLQTIVGTIIKLQGNHMHLRVPTGTIRGATFAVDPQAEVTVSGNELALVSLGDTVSATGHRYVGPGIATASQLFADEISIRKPQ